MALESLGKVALAFLAWLGWDAITDHAGQLGGFAGRVLVGDFLAALFVSALVGTLIGLFPVRFLPGHKLRSWHQGAWLGTFIVTLFVVVQVLLRPGSTPSGPSHSPLVTTVALFVLFGGGSLAFREHFARKLRRAEAMAEASTEAGASSVIVLAEAREVPERADTGG